MKNISFANPYFLLIAIPVLLLTFIPFFIAVRKRNRGARDVAALVIHSLAVILTALALAGTAYTALITRTEVVVVADLSHSMHRDHAEIDAKIAEIEESLPRNSQLAVVCFGKDHTLHTPFGEEIRGVGSAEVDGSATNIADALDYSATLFSEDTVKRVILITDAGLTDEGAEGELVRAVDGLFSLDVEVDAVYIDSSLDADAREVQISGVDYTKSTYLNHEVTADVLLQSTYEAKAILTLYRDGQSYTERAVTLAEGFNVVNIELPTSEERISDYTVTVSVPEDASEYNNSYSFTQSVSGNIKVLLISTKRADIEFFEELYGDRATVDSYVNRGDVPYSIEELCKYDEIILSDVDVRELDNVEAFLENLDKVVSQFGKSLITFGNTDIQNKEDERLTQLQNMLPVKYGNNEQDPKLVTILLDTSRSLENAARYDMAIEATRNMLKMLDDEDYVSVITFSGDATVAQPPVPASQRDEIMSKLSGITLTQGTFIGKAFSTAYSFMKDLDYSDKQVILISDGMSYTTEADDPVDIAADMYANGIVSSVINVSNPDERGVSRMKRIAAGGNGKYYYIESPSTLDEQMFSEVADDITETAVENDSAVTVKRTKDKVVSGIDALPNISGYIYAKIKANANTVLTTEYERSGGGRVEVPLYAYWSYGNGRVSSFTSTLTGEWVSEWQSEEGRALFENIFLTNTPSVKIDHPYTVNIQSNNTVTRVEVIPASVDPDAVVNISIRLPGGETLSDTLVFDSLKYFYEFASADTGKYVMDINYSYADKTFAAEEAFHISYAAEYDSFAFYNVSALHGAIRNRGEICTDGVPSTAPDEEDLSSYTVHFTVPFLIIAISLYVVEIIIRKLSAKDVKSFFGRGGRNGV